MKMFLTISNLRYNEDGFSYHFINNEAEKRLIDLIPEFNGFQNMDFDTALCYSVTIAKKDESAIICKIVGLEKTDSGTKILLEKKNTLEYTCSSINRRLFAVQCRLGLRNERNLYVMVLNEDDFNSVVYPEEIDKKYENLVARLNGFKSASRWLDMLREFGDLNEFQEKYPTLWNDARFLDNYLVFPLSQLVKPGDKYGKRAELLQFFNIFITRVLEIYPSKIDTLSVLAYFHYGNYIAPKSSHEKADFDKAVETLNTILRIDPSHITSLYRLAKLYQAYLEQIRFTVGIDRRQYYEQIISYHTKVMNLFEENRQALSRHAYEYQSSIFNIVKFKQEYTLDFSRVFFEKKVFNNEVGRMLTSEKAVEIDDNITLMYKLEKEMGFDIDTPISDMVSATKKNQIDVLYRMALAFQVKAIYNLLMNINEPIEQLLILSNKYIKKAFDLFFERKKRNISERKPNYLYKVQALNNYLLDKKDAAYDSLKKGQSDSLFMLAELLFLDKRFDDAINELNKIQPNDRLNMYDKSQKLKTRIDDVRNN